MKPIEKITLLCALIAVTDACTSDKRLLAPGGSKPLTADAVAEDQPVYGPWGTPDNLGPAVNSPDNDNMPAISKDGLSLYITPPRTPPPPGARPGGLGGPPTSASHRATPYAPAGE